MFLASGLVSKKSSRYSARLLRSVEVNGDVPLVASIVDDLNLFIPALAEIAVVMMALLLDAFTRAPLGVAPWQLSQCVCHSAKPSAMVANAGAEPSDSA